MYENTPQWRHSFFDKCEFWERRLNLLVSQIFYCDIGIGFIVKDARRLGFTECFFFYVLVTWLTTYGVTHETWPRRNLQTFV